MVRLRFLRLALLAAGAALADTTFVSGAAEPSSTAPPPPTITSTEALTWTVGVGYTFFEFSGKNGAPPDTWSWNPPLTAMGLSLNPTIGRPYGTPTRAGEFPTTLKLTDALGRSDSVPIIMRVSFARPPSTFTETGSLTIPRSGHTATLLTTGEVLVTGGGNGVADKTAELYNPATGTFARTAGIMLEARIGHTATVLGNPKMPNYGKVLILGSVGTSAELYDPEKRTFAATGSMHHARTSPTATLLNTGKVLVVGGDPTTADLRAELYDPASGTFSYTGSTTTLRSGHTATLLIGGNVLIAGGTAAAGATAEIYSPTTGTFTPTAGHMTAPRSGHTATLLGTEDGSQNGSVLIIGTDASADLYNPYYETFTRVGSLFLGRYQAYGHTASLINERGAVLLAGGYFVGSTDPAACGSRVFPISSYNSALFAPESDGFNGMGSLNTARDGHSATVLADGVTVLVVGGTQHQMTVLCNEVIKVLASAEFFGGVNLAGSNAILSPTTLSFTGQSVGAPTSLSVTLKNYGVATLDITRITTTAHFTQTDTCGASLDSGGSCSITVTFTPTAKGSIAGTLSVIDNAPGSPQSVSLTGVLQ